MPAEGRDERRVIIRPLPVLLSEDDDPASAGEWEAYVDGYDHVRCLGASPADAAEELYDDLSASLEAVCAVAMPTLDTSTVLGALRERVAAAVLTSGRDLKPN